jgi:hypothetical protein
MSTSTLGKLTIQHQKTQHPRNEKKKTKYWRKLEKFSTNCKGRGELAAPTQVRYLHLLE